MRTNSTCFWHLDKIYKIVNPVLVSMFSLHETCLHYVSTIYQENLHCSLMIPLCRLANIILLGTMLPFVSKVWSWQYIFFKLVSSHCCLVSFEMTCTSTEILMHSTGTGSLREKESLHLHSNLYVVMAAHEGTGAVQATKWRTPHAYTHAHIPYASERRTNSLTPTNESATAPFMELWKYACCWVLYMVSITEKLKGALSIPEKKKDICRSCMVLRKWRAYESSLFPSHRWGWTLGSCSACLKTLLTSLANRWEISKIFMKWLRTLVS